MIVSLLALIILSGIAAVIGLAYLHDHHPAILRWGIVVAGILAPWWLAYQQKSNPEAAAAIRRIEEHPAARVVNKLDAIYWPLVLGTFMVGMLAWWHG